MRTEDFLAPTVASCAALLPAASLAGPAASLPAAWPPLVSGLHRIAYTEWGPRDARHTVICAHGFSRNGRDFDTLAGVLAQGCRVVCPDFAGRGRSGWLGYPSVDAGYNLWQNLVDSVALIARLDVEQVDWVGTSMGGLVGMMLATLPETPVRRLVLNDVGCVVPGAFLADLAGYVSKDPDLDDVEAVEAYMRDIYTGFTGLTDAQWRHLAEHGHRHKENHKLGLAFDPKIGVAVAPPFDDVDLRGIWLGVRSQVLLLRGEISAALPRAVAEEMTTTGPRARLVEIPGAGHAPMLMAAEQTELVATWLRTGQRH
jgi:pimeloyl-ACP methyl ester carboxylesterase